MLQKLLLPPGVLRNGTQYQSAGRWYDANLVRWVNGVMRPVGGWISRTASALTGMPRSIIAWRANNGTRHVAIGTNNKLYAVSSSAAITDITPTGFTAGNADSTIITGYGYGVYGDAEYGTPRPDTGATTVTPAATWQLDTWGERLVACCSSDGKLYEWDLNTSNDAVAITNAPTSCTGLIVTEERILMALGAGGDPRKVSWSDQEDNTAWTTSQTNKAGDFILSTVGTIRSARRVRGGTLIFTDVDVHLANYLGYPLVYGFNKVAANCGLLGPSAVVAVDSLAFWMGQDGFFVYDGTVRDLPSDVRSYVFGRLNRSQGSKTSAFHNSVNSEVWWLYPSGSECDSYVAYNYAENHWTIGSIARTCGVDRGVYSSPLMVGSDGYVYDHETGFGYGGATPYAESGPVELGNGDTVMHVLKLIPDEQTSADCSVQFKHRFYPNATETTTSSYTLSSPTSVRFTGRQATLRVAGARPADWRWGVPRIEVKSGGLRG